MATALAKGWIAAGLLTAERVSASDPLPEARQAFQAAVESKAIADNTCLVAASDVVVLAVKPQTLAAVLAEIRPALTSRHLLISIVAGATLGQLASALGASIRLIRVMPNTPS